jgi:hypothetical protein
LMEEGSLDYDEGFVRLQIHMNFDTNIHRQHEHLRVTMSATHGTSTGSVDSTRNLSTTLGVQVYTTTPGPFAVSSLQAQALVSELLYYKIQR